MNPAKQVLFAVLCVLALIYLLGATYRDVTRDDDPSGFVETLVGVLLVLAVAWVVLS